MKILPPSRDIAVFGIEWTRSIRRDWARHQKINKNNIGSRTCWANDRRAPGKIYIWHWIFFLLYFFEESSLHS